MVTALILVQKMLRAWHGESRSPHTPRQEVKRGRRRANASTELTQLFICPCDLPLRELCVPIHFHLQGRLRKGAQRSALTGKGGGHRAEAPRRLFPITWLFRVAHVPCLLPAYDLCQGWGRLRHPSCHYRWQLDLGSIQVPGFHKQCQCSPWHLVELVLFLP